MQVITNIMLPADIYGFYAKIADELPHTTAEDIIIATLAANYKLMVEQESAPVFSQEIQQMLNQLDQCSFHEERLESIVGSGFFRSLIASDSP